MTTDPDLPLLMDLLGDADPDVRLRAALDLGEAAYTPAAAALVERFGMERDFYIRETLTWAALRMPDAALPLVREALASPRWLARLQATHTVSKVGSPDDAARLVPLVADPVDAVASRAYWAAAQTGEVRVIPCLVAQLSRGNSEHQNSLTVALGLFGAAAVPALVRALCNGAEEARRHAADTLSHMGSPDADGAVAALVDAVADPEEPVRLAALNALGQLVVPSAWEVIDVATTAPEERLRHLAQRLTERRPSDRALRMAALRQRAAGATVGGAAPTSASVPELVGASGPGPLGSQGSGTFESRVTPAPPAGPWPEPDLSLITVEGGPQAVEMHPRLALQVEVCRPRYLSREDVPAEVLAGIHAEAEAEAVAAGKPPALAARMAAGRTEQFIHETVLLEQVSVSNPGTTVEGMLVGKGIRIMGFATMATGARLPPPPAPPG